MKILHVIDLPLKFKRDCPSAGIAYLSCLSVCQSVCGGGIARQAAPSASRLCGAKGAAFAAPLHF